VEEIGQGISVYSPGIAWERSRKPKKAIFRIIGVTADIRIEHLQNMQEVLLPESNCLSNSLEKRSFGRTWICDDAAQMIYLYSEDRTWVELSQDSI
jgi:hypothetical protein